MTVGTTTRKSTKSMISGERGDWKERLGRVGLVGKGVLFGVIGLLALQIARGDAAADATHTGAIEWVGEQPLGKFLLVALTVSLFALAAWRLLDAAVGDPVEGSETSDRVKYGAKGVVYLGLGIAAATTTAANWNGSGSSGSSEDERSAEATATVLEWPLGRWLVMAIGAGVIAVALYIVKKHVVDRDFLQRMSITSTSWIAGFGRFGYAARAVAYALIGYFLVQAGATYEPQRAKGLSGTLLEVSGQTWGQLLLWAVAIGLLAYGVFTLAEAKYRRAA